MDHLWGHREAMKHVVSLQMGQKELGGNITHLVHEKWFDRVPRSVRNDGEVEVYTAGARR